MLRVSYFGRVYRTFRPFCYATVIFILLRSAAVSPEIKGFTRALVLRRGGRTDRGLAPAPGVDRVKSAGVMQIHRPLPFSFG